jgi:hypothetical protein
MARAPLGNDRDGSSCGLLWIKKRFAGGLGEKDNSGAYASRHSTLGRTGAARMLERVRSSLATGRMGKILEGRSRERPDPSPSPQAARTVLSAGALAPARHKITPIPGGQWYGMRIKRDAETRRNLGRHQRLPSYP